MHRSSAVNHYCLAGDKEILLDETKKGLLFASDKSA
jgi:hypothetical protein